MSVVDVLKWVGLAVWVGVTWTGTITQPTPMWVKVFVSILLVITIVALVRAEMLALQYRREMSEINDKKNKGTRRP